LESLRKDAYYTYSDYVKWDDGIRYELIDGVAYMMSPAPSWIHQEISGNLFGQLWQFLRGKPCKVYSAPFDVRLNAAQEDDTVVQPDIVVICDKSKLNDAGCAGAPDMLIEILSKSSARFDKHVKLQKYLKYGVREYWIIDPDSRTVQVYTLKDDNYIVSTYDETDEVNVTVLDGCVINLGEVFTL